jgi:uncharacterized peroxidase-related enzyme
LLNHWVPLNLAASDFAGDRENAMTFIKTIPEDRAEGETAVMYERNKSNSGYVPNFVKAFSYRPDVMDSFDALLDSIKKHMDPRRYELVTIAAAKEMKCSYCMLAHGTVLKRDFFGVGQLTKIASDPAESGLSEADKEVMAFAAKVVRDAVSVTADDVEKLRKHGLSEADILDVVTAAAARCFISKTADALGALPDSKFRELEPELRKVLVVGRPISD